MPQINAQGSRKPPTLLPGLTLRFFPSPLSPSAQLHSIL